MSCLSFCLSFSLHSFTPTNRFKHFPTFVFLFCDHSRIFIARIGRFAQGTITTTPVVDHINHYTLAASSHRIISCACS
ncbi:hypothetical protein BT63DRAFT_221908 [Microthyrium microscopicum]|uniref:Uncharacterized protein n=1 Tax=Microthyrium microscopicum TaxID=703497 RepID=A0A6A6UC14_9PEZI|nr:hypothetical protein BT63DRAFT_221908 [Microthyrium microscopicum]